MIQINGARFLVLKNDCELLVNFFQSKGVLLHKVDADEDSLYIHLGIWAKPGAKKERIEVGEEGEIILFIKDKPIEGKANKALIKTISKKMGIGQSDIEIISGLKSKHKRFSLHFHFTKNKNLGYYLEKLNLLL